MKHIKKIALCTLLVIAPVQQASAIVWFAPLLLLGKGTVVAKGTVVVAAKVATASKAAALAKVSVVRTAIVKTTVVKTQMTKTGVAIGGAASAKSAIAVQSGQHAPSVGASTSTSVGKTLSRQLSNAQHQKNLKKFRETVIGEVVGEVIEAKAPALIESMSVGKSNKK